MFFRQYINEMGQLGVNSIGIVLLISFFIGAVITIQIKLNIESPFMPRWTVGYVTREIMLLEFSSSIMCLILAGKVGSNIASELGTMRVTQQIDALEIMGVNSANYLILPKIAAMVTTIPLMVTFSIFAGIIGAFCTCWFGGIMSAVDLEYGLQYMFVEWFIWCGIIKSLFYHCQRIGILRLHRRRRFHRSGQGVHRLRSMQQRTYLIRRPNINSTFNGMIELKGLCKSFEEKEVLTDINATFENGKTNLSLADVGGELLLISQFTLYANCKKGNRPSFIEAGSPDHANALYEYIIEKCKERVDVVEQGEFGAEMKVELLNDGPFTVILDSEQICG